jgi:hypothetical protein
MLGYFRINAAFCLFVVLLLSKAMASSHESNSLANYINDKGVSFKATDFISKSMSRILIIYNSYLRSVKYNSLAL